MIGVFDSGFGGLVILKELTRRFPHLDFMYFGDNARAPYGTRSREEVFTFTLQAVEFLFAQGCDLVILACNTASAFALRRIQTEILPVKYPHKKVLGILVPTVEQVTGAVGPDNFINNGVASFKKIAVFATPGTVSSLAYVEEIAKRRPDAVVFQVASANLASLIESGASSDTVKETVVDCVNRLHDLMGKEWPPDAVLLGCTHYPLVKDIFIEALPAGMHVYDQALMVALSLGDYLLRHHELADRLKKTSQRFFLTSGDAHEISALASNFYGQEIVFKNTRELTLF